MDHKMQGIKKEKGFTLIEVIAVILILSILAVIAVPKYVDLVEEAKISAAQSQVAEMKSTLNLAYASLFIRTGLAPTTGLSVLEEAGFDDALAQNVGTAPDIWNVTLTGAGTSVNISVNSRNGDTEYVASGTWHIP